MVLMARQWPIANSKVYQLALRELRIRRSCIRVSLASRRQSTSDEIGILTRKPCSAELSTDVFLGVLFLRLVEDRVRRARLDEITRTPAVRGIDIEKRGYVRHPLRLLQIVGDDHDR